ncbi:MAG: hypothetical protein CSA66_06920 [Proteobacteria bacterium]|nr:MAG: hypothetical protein CSA66_06920 [Pseudomonadota bacterium]
MRSAVASLAGAAFTVADGGRHSGRPDDEVDVHDAAVAAALATALDAGEAEERGPVLTAMRSPVWASSGDALQIPGGHAGASLPAVGGA